MAFSNFYNKRVYVDLDGCICDLIAQWNLLTRTQMSPKDFEDMYGTEALYEEFKKYGEKFWSTMPWCKDGQLLWNYIDKYKPIILTTAIPTEECKIGKEKWVRKFLPIKVEIIFSDNKEEWSDKDSLLIDDNGKNVRKFIIAGGSGIIHKSSVETIKQLKEIFGM
jgi:5'(3')-deoxyribonucleotidase